MYEIMELSNTGNKIIDHNKAYEDQKNILPHEECCNDVQESISSCAGIVKRRPLEMLSIPDDVFRQVQELCVEMIFEN
ncbi:7074_t:CDS:2 [Cetraspora pellucida]|uniref:7074_t:CDS:1 n=1 Tax=Cetraspora pellucida TaxID=1433469 RepID=A0A9N8WMC4_9GLOM|nr:7074_t:CDS:2 [Cetraspora pellucida]